MTSFFRWLVIAGSLVLVVGLTASTFAQAPPARQRRASTYDLKTETTLLGVVQAVENIAAPTGRGRRGLGGTHLVLKTDKEAVEVHLGPSAYLNEKKITIAQGDSLEILGSRVIVDDEPVFLARQVKKGEATWVLRDASGRPLWSGGRRRAME